MNPFITSGYAGDKYFCDRVQETADILRLLQNGNNVALISPRRYGKTDLLRHCFAQPNIAENYYTFIIDIYSAKSFPEMVSQMGKIILETLKPRGKKVIEHFLNILTSVKAGISFDMYGMPSWTLGVGDISAPATTLDEIFRFLREADKPCFVALDEFQQITRYGDESIEAALRTHIQYCPNAHFVFSGSQRHLMGNIFTSPGRPFYQSVALYSLQRLPLDKYTEFCKSLFNESLKTLDDDVVPQVYERFDGITYYMQRVMNELFARTEQNSACTTKDIDNALAHIIEVSSFIYEDLLYQLPDKQTQLLKAICAEGKAQNLTSGKFVKRHALLSSSSVKSALTPLLDKGLITNETGVYELYDRFLDLWLKKQL